MSNTRLRLAGCPVPIRNVPFDREPDLRATARHAAGVAEGVERSGSVAPIEMSPIDVRSVDCSVSRPAAAKQTLEVAGAPPARPRRSSRPTMHIRAEQALKLRRQRLDLLVDRRWIGLFANGT